MTARNDARLKMIAAVIALYNLFKAKFDVIPRIKTLFTDVIIPKYNAIQLKLNEARQSTRDTTEMKNKEKDELAVAVFDLQNPLKAYAASTGDLVLKGLAGRTLIQLKRLKQEEVEDTCQAIIDKAAELQADLEPYGLTEQMLTTANAKMTLWDTWYTATTLKKGAISSSKTDVNNMITELTDLLEEQMDPLVKTIPDDVDTKEKYDSVRVIIAPGQTQTQLHFLVTYQNGDGSLHPLYLVDLSLHMTYIDKKKVTHHIEKSGKTDIDGIAIFKPVRQGFYDFEIMKPGYEVYAQLQHQVKRGQITYVGVVLRPQA